MRASVILAALLVLAVAVPADAKLVYVTQPASASPVVHVAKDNGRQPRRLGIGRAPTIAPNGAWVAFVTVPAGRARLETVVLQRFGQGAQRLVLRGKGIASLRFSPDSAKLAAVVGGKRLRVYDIARDKVREAARGHIREYAFSPDSRQIVVGLATKAAPDAPSDLHVGPALGGASLTRLTSTQDALNPVWGPREIVYDRQDVREGDAAAYNLWALDPDAPARARRLTDLTIPRLANGLVPLEVSADGRRLLAVFTGQDVQVGFTVSMRTGRTRALSTDFESGLVGFDLSRDGRFILAHTGGPDPANQHNVVRVRYGGGTPRTLVESAAFPDWTR